ncbi:MAG: universal stress protein [Burkholderiaceae bacterium]|jgi:LSD1 subclass zinc finger protein|nr:universal stress protein [Burkholderiaceae bacterium]
MKILIPVDGSACSDDAVAFVASRSTLIGTQPDVELLNVQLPVPPRAARAVGAEIVREYHAKDAKAVLKPSLAKLAKRGLTAHSRHVVGNPGAAVADAAAAVDLVVMGSHGHTALKGLLFGSVTNAVLSGCRTPLLVMRGARSPVRDSLKVGIALDGSAYGLAAVRYVVEHRDLFGALPAIELINVVPDLFSMVIPGFGDAPAPLYPAERVLAAQDVAFENVMAPARQLLEKAGLQASEVRLIGNSAGDEIAAHSTRRKLDLLVIGSHGHGLLKSAVMGSVATRVAARCSTPMLLIRRTARR